MENLKLVYKYFMQVAPELERRQREAAASLYGRLKACGSKRERQWTPPGTDDLKCAGVLALSEAADLENTTGFIASLDVLCRFLDGIAELNEPRDIAVFRQIYLPLSDSVDPGRPVSNSYGYFNDGTGACLGKLVETCRSHICQLPSYKLVTGKMKKYVQLYIELQSCKYQPQKIRRDHLRRWSEYYIRLFPEISYWEFAASADSLLGIFAMFISASASALSEDEVENLDNTYLPWICAFHRLLCHYASVKEDTMAGRLNFSDFYRNLKHCEERLVYFSQNAVKRSAVLGNGKIHQMLAQAMPAIYLSAPGAYFGLNRMASRKILTASPPETRILWSCSRLLQALK